MSDKLNNLDQLVFQLWFRCDEPEDEALLYTSAHWTRTSKYSTYNATSSTAK